MIHLAKMLLFCLQQRKRRRKKGEEDEAIKVVLIGPGYSGKSSLLHRYLHGRMGPVGGYEPTLLEMHEFRMTVDTGKLGVTGAGGSLNSSASRFGLLVGFRKQQAKESTSSTSELVRLEASFWDTAGVPDYDRLRPLSYAGADAVALCIALDRPDQLAEAKEGAWREELRMLCPRTPLILVGKY